MKICSRHHIRTERSRADYGECVKYVRFGFIANIKAANNHPWLNCQVFVPISNRPMRKKLWRSSRSKPERSLWLYSESNTVSLPLSILGLRTYGDKRNIIEHFLQRFGFERKIGTYKLTDKRQCNKYVSDPKRADKLVCSGHFIRREKTNHIEKCKQYCPNDRVSSNSFIHHLPSAIGYFSAILLLDR